jgi:uncharacterized protein (TIGR02678 family)
MSSINSNRLNAPERLRDEVTTQAAIERRAVIRALLMHPLLPAGGEHAEAFAKARRHQDFLTEWFARWAGWTFRLQPGLARLEKSAATDDDSTRGATDTNNKTPLTRRRYALLCLSMAVLEAEDRQTTLRQVAERVELAARTDPGLVGAGFEIDLRTQEHRRDLVCVMRLLAEGRVLSRLDGDDSQYLRGDGDCLYVVDHALLSAMLHVARGPSTIDAITLSDRIAALRAASRDDTDELRNRELQHRLVRRLLDDPVLYIEDLTEAEIEYFQRQRHRILAELEQVTGLVAEVRAEGVAMLDADGDLSDFHMPEAGTRGHATLLVAEWLSGTLQDGPSCTVSRADVVDRVARLADEHQSHWRKGIIEADNSRQLAEEVIHVLESLRLILVRQDTIRPLPAIARYRIAAPKIAQPRLRQEWLL